MNTPETETPICKHCGEYEHDCKCAASREIANLMRELQEAKDKSNAFEMALEERNEHCADAKEKVRTLERENAQLRKELEEAKPETRRALGVVNSKTAVIAIIEGNQEAALNSFNAEQKQRRAAETDRDHFKSLAQTNWKMAEQTIRRIEHRCACRFVMDPTGPCDCGYERLHSEFQTLKQQQPK